MTGEREAKLARVGDLVARSAPVRAAILNETEDLANLTHVSLDEMRHSRWAVSMPSRFVWAKLDDFQGTTADKLQEWSDDPRGRNLLLIGSVGSGKSHAAVAACRGSFFRGLDVIFAPVVEMLDDLRPGGPPGYLTELMGLDRLILDDLGLERPTDWTAERLYALVNRRWLEERPTIATTNLSPEKLEEAVGERMFSRLAGNAVTIGISGPDRRAS